MRRTKGMAGWRRAARGRRVIAIPVVAAATALLGGCAQHVAPGPRIQIGTAYVAQPDSGGTTDAYVLIQNNGSTDRLVAAQSSAGGRVTLRGPADGRASASGVVMRTVPDIRIPAGQSVRFTPNGFHLLITGSGPMAAGREVTLTLVFARAGAVRISTEVTNPQSGGSSYFIN